MTKYNITPRKEKKIVSAYRSSVSPEMVEDIARQIITKLMIEKKYRDPKYSAKQLAIDLGVNMRHISAVINVRFQQNYSELVGKMREADTDQALFAAEQNLKEALKFLARHDNPEVVALMLLLEILQHLQRAVGAMVVHQHDL